MRLKDAVALNSPAFPRDAAKTSRRSFSRWRAASLICVYVLFAIHFAHWKLAGKTLAPLELNEVMYTLEHGVVTAGFIFMSAAVLSVMIFGRFFCSWGCHILALQDLCEWLLKKSGIRPKPVRSRMLLLVPVGAMFYMFVWPQVPRLLHAIWPNPPLPVAPAPPWKLRILNELDHAGWTSFVTTNLWRNLPGPWVTVLTFLIVGFVIVYILGTRSFCTYGCPYGALFGLADRIAPGKIMAAGNQDACVACGKCTAVCQSHIRVHEELTVFGKVVSPACLKDLDCVAVCPNGEVKYGFTWPSGFKSWRKHGRFGVPYDFTLAEDLLMAGTFFGTLLIYRGLYEALPFLMCLGLAACVAYGSVLITRLMQPNRWRDIRLNPFQLRRAGKIKPAGRVFVAVCVLFLVLSAHSAAIRFHEVAGQRAWDALASAAQAGRDPDPSMAATAIEHLQVCDRWGLIRPASIETRLASLFSMSPTPDAAEPYIRRILARQSSTAPDVAVAPWRLTLAAILLMRHDAAAALEQLDLLDQALANTSVHSDEADHWQILSRQMREDIHKAQSLRPSDS